MFLIPKQTSCRIYQLKLCHVAGSYHLAQHSKSFWILKANIYSTNILNQSMEDRIIECWKQNLFWKPTFASAPWKSWWFAWIFSILKILFSKSHSVWHQINKTKGSEVFCFYGNLSLHATVKTMHMAGQFTIAAENLPLRKRKLDSNFSKKPRV